MQTQEAEHIDTYTTTFGTFENYLKNVLNIPFVAEFEGDKSQKALDDKYKKPGYPKAAYKITSLGRDRNWFYPQVNMQRDGIYTATGSYHPAGVVYTVELVLYFRDHVSKREFAQKLFLITNKGLDKYNATVNDFTFEISFKLHMLEEIPFGERQDDVNDYSINLTAEVHTIVLERNGTTEVVLVEQSIEAMFELRDAREALASGLLPQDAAKVTIPVNRLVKFDRHKRSRP